MYYDITNKESARLQSHRLFLNFVKLKFPHVVKIWQPYDRLFRNTWENRVNTREDIFSYSYSLFCAIFYKVWCDRAVIGVVFFSGDISGSDLAVGFFFFCKFRPSCFQVSFLFSSFSFCLSYIVNNFCYIYVFHK